MITTNVNISREQRLWEYPSVLIELYHGQSLSQREIGRKLGCSHSAVGKSMRELGIETRNSCSDLPPPYRISPQGYWLWSHTLSDTERCRVLEHRLLAVAKYGFDAVKDMHVHHRNHHKFDNRLENIELMTPSDHHKHHANHPGFSND